MLLKSLSLTNFRNYSRASFDFSPTTTLVVGPNASGKTNLLEAVYFLAAGKSFRAQYDREVIKGGEDLAWIKGIKGLKGVKEGDDGNLELTILANEKGENTSSKRFKVNGVKKARAYFAGNLRAVVFSPEEILLVTGSPSRRRKFIDAVLSQISREYARNLAEYEKVLRQRNRLLVLLKEKGDKACLPAGRGVNEQLEFWDGRLVGLGSHLTLARKRLFAKLNQTLADELFLDYQPKPLDRGRLEQEREREVGAGMTLRGPHREDFTFIKKVFRAVPSSRRDGVNPSLISDSPPSLNVPPKSDESESENLPRFGSTTLSSGTSLQVGRDLSIYGSRGEQRLAVLHLKRAELEFIASKSAQRPILLLDDIFSELDENNRGQVLSLLGKQQTIITATDLDQIDGEKLREFEVLQLQRC